MTLKKQLNSVSLIKTKKTCSNYQRLAKKGRKLLDMLWCLMQMEKMFLFLFTSSILIL